MKWMVRAKSGMSFERETSKRSKITLHSRELVNREYLPSLKGMTKGNTYSRKLTSIQQSPNVHPTVLSPLRLCQLKTKSILNVLPATRDVKSIITVAQK